MSVLYALAASRILTMRSNNLFFAMETVFFAFNTYIYVFVPLNSALHVICTVATYLFLPAAMSVGPIKTRISRITLLYSVVLLTELLGVTLYSILNHGVSAPNTFTEDNVFSNIVIYLILIFATESLLEILVSVIRRFDGTSGLSFEAPTALLFLVSALLTSSAYMRLMYLNRGLGPAAIASLIYCWVSLAAVYLIFWTARREAKVQRELIELAIAARGIRHTKREVENMAWRAEGMSSLRHALANQVRDITRLAESGETDEAGRQLSRLCEQVQILSGNTQTEYLQK